MKKVVISKLTIQNFQSIQGLVINAEGHNVKASGHNGAGKSTLANAFTWLLFGKDAAGNRDDDLLIPRDKSGGKLTGHELEPTVEAVIDIFADSETEDEPPEHQTVTLKKVYAEQIPTRGAQKGKYQGSKVVYYVNGLEVKARDYNEKVSEICSEDVFQKITDPNYLLSLDWKALRNILVPLVGELNVPMPDELSQRMKDRPYDEFKQLSAQQLKTQGKTHDKAHTAVEALYGNMPQKPEGDSKALKSEISELRVKQSTIKYDLDGLEADSAGLAHRRTIAEAEGNIQAARVKYQEGLDTENKKVRDGIAKLEMERDDKAKADSMAVQKIDRLTYRVKTLNEQRITMLGDYKALNTDYKAKQALQYHGENICLMCGQPLPPEQIETAQKRFNAKKSEELESTRKKIDSNVAEGKAIAEEISKTQAAISDVKAKIDTLSAEIAKLDGRITEGRDMLISDDFTTTDEYKVLSEKLEKLKAAQDPGDERVAQITALKKQLADIEAQIAVKVQEQADFNAALKSYNDAQTRLKELAAAEKDAGAAYDDACKADALCRDYDKTKAKALEKAVNSMFKHVQFNLFEQLDNGGERETCKVMVYNDRGMLSPKPSTGERIAAGMDIIKELQRFYGVEVPIFVDNAEGVTKPIDTDAQLFKLCVTEDKNLKVEVI